MIKTLHQVQKETDRKNQRARELVSEAAQWLDFLQDCYDREDRCIFDNLLGICDSAFFVQRLGCLATTRINLDNARVDLEIAIAQAESVKTQCGIDLDAAYARRDQAILQAALDKQGGWLTE